MQIVRRTLFDSELLRVGHVVARPSSSECGEIERQSLNILVLPLAGVFAKHDGPRRHVIATPNHAVFIAAGRPYRISYPAGIGDQCLTLCISSATLARVLPEAMSRNDFESSAFASHVLLPPAVMLVRSLLWRRFVRGEWDPLEVEKLGIGLFASALYAACEEHHGRSRSRPYGPSDRRYGRSSVSRKRSRYTPSANGPLANWPISPTSPPGISRTFSARKWVRQFTDMYSARASPRPWKRCSIPTQTSPQSRSRRALRATVISRPAFAHFSD